MRPRQRLPAGLMMVCCCYGGEPCDATGANQKLRICGQLVQKVALPPRKGACGEPRCCPCQPGTCQHTVGGRGEDAIAVDIPRKRRRTVWHRVIVTTSREVGGANLPGTIGPQHLAPPAAVRAQVRVRPALTLTKLSLLSTSAVPTVMPVPTMVP